MRNYAVLWHPIRAGNRLVHEHPDLQRVRMYYCAGILFQWMSLSFGAAAETESESESDAVKIVAALPCLSQSGCRQTGFLVGCCVALVDAKCASASESTRGW